MKTNTHLITPMGELHLLRFPEQGEHSPLQAWDAGDEYLLKHVHDEYLLAEHASDNHMFKHKMLIVNDEFGALSCALHAYSPLVCSDSYMSQLACEKNALRNELPAPKCIDSLDLDRLSKQAEYTQNVPFKMVLIKLPRTMALLEQQLHSLSKLVDAKTVIIAAAKVKSVTSNVIKLFSQTMGNTRTSLALKKARLIFCQVDASLTDKAKPAEQFISKVEDAHLPFTLYNHANTFCREHLDIGARLLLQHLPKNLTGHCIDLGCGNGVLGTSLMLENKALSVSFVDESYMALASAELVATKATSEEEVNDRAEFVLSHCLQTLIEQRAPKVELVVCNPPFHQLNVLTDQIAWQMFLDAKRMLKADGELRVVANRHLDYIPKLKRLFGNCEVVASNKKFVVLSAIKAL